MFFVNQMIDIVNQTVDYVNQNDDKDLREVYFFDIFHIWYLLDFVIFQSKHITFYHFYLKYP